MIQAQDINIKNLLSNQKFIIDYFQREYKWETEQINTLIDDLVSEFLLNYTKGDSRQQVQNYNSYYLGPIILSSVPGGVGFSIIDGQQRITSLTLLLIYLNNLQKSLFEENPQLKKEEVVLDGLIYSTSFGQEGFNISNEERKNVLESLFKSGFYKINPQDSFTVKNMSERYHDIDMVFPVEFKNEEILFHFIDWLIEKVILVKIHTDNNDNAYRIFETMNDRGLNLTSSEMLKGYVLSKITDEKQRQEIDSIWKEKVLKLNSYKKDLENDFFQAWFRAKYAEKMRAGQKNSVNEDFELIGSRFHNWFRNNHQNLLGISTSQDFYNFFKDDFVFFIDNYIEYYDKKINFDKDYEYIYYLKNLNFAESLSGMIFLASLEKSDTKKDIQDKWKKVGKVVERFIIARIVNNKNYGQSKVKSLFFILSKKIRNWDNNINKIFDDFIQSDNNSLDSISNFKLHGNNKKYIKHILARITSYVEELSGGQNNLFTSYIQSTGKDYEIEHIIGDNYSLFVNQFPSQKDFDEFRNSIGNLILLPNGTNQSLSNSGYDIKIKSYLRENILAKSLNSDFYKNNPNFLNNTKQFNFKGYADFGVKEVTERGGLYSEIINDIWKI